MSPSPVIGEGEEHLLRGHLMFHLPYFGSFPLIQAPSGDSAWCLDKIGRIHSHVSSTSRSLHLVHPHPSRPRPLSALFHLYIGLISLSYILLQYISARISAVSHHYQVSYPPPQSIVNLSLCRSRPPSSSFFVLYSIHFSSHEYLSSELSPTPRLE